MSAKNEPAVRVGVVGLGRSGWHNHSLILKTLAEQFTVAAVTDPDAERCKEAVEVFSCKAYSTLDALLEDPDVELVVLAIPSHLHYEQTLRILKAGKHVVVEKPMAIGVDQCDGMIAAAKKAGRMLTVFQQQRFMPSFMKVREVIDSGKLGRITLIRIAAHDFGRRWDWQTLRAFNGGSLMNMGPHFMDQALQFIGSAEPEIFCDLQRTLTSGDAEDHVKMVLRAQDAPVIDLEIASASAYRQDFWLVMGTSGGLKGTPSQLSWKYVDFSKMPPRPVDPSPTPGRGYYSEELDWTEESWELPEDALDARASFYLDLYKTMREGAPLEITPESVRRQIAILEKCRALCPVT
jgi:predicted dehydrogenase